MIPIKTDVDSFSFFTLWHYLSHSAYCSVAVWEHS
uniref:Uncharacterized protein n=1 Tax=Anguilla anguilla TaxID=7936 RepID=A0A0E9SE56_ANGAN